MRTISYTTRFKRDLKREHKGQHGKKLEALLTTVVDMLKTDQALPQSYRDHALSGEWKDHRDCHIKPDLILIYRKPDETAIELVRLGSHSELGLK